MKKSIGLMVYAALMAFLLLKYEVAFDSLPLWSKLLVMLVGLLLGLYLVWLIIAERQESKNIAPWLVSQRR